MQRCSRTSFHEIEFVNLRQQKVEFLRFFGRELPIDILCKKIVQLCLVLGCLCHAG